uniref:Uncharacterized protein n=1 Tax=Arundo donax TaxID=35708 RepID=A0A0A8ZQI9_ARUDO
MPVSDLHKEHNAHLYIINSTKQTLCICVHSRKIWACKPMQWSVKQKSSYMVIALTKG